MYAEAALNAALAAGDPDLELRALAQLGFARVSGGEVDEGLASSTRRWPWRRAVNRRASRRLQTSAAR